MTAVEFDESCNHVFNNGNPPGDPILQRLVAQLLVKMDTVIGLLARDKKGKPIKFKRFTAKEYAPASFKRDDPAKLRVSEMDKARSLALGIIKKRNG